MTSIDDIALSALVAKVLVAYTIEADNLFEQRLAAIGHREQLSLIAWANYLQHVDGGRATAGRLAEQTHSTMKYVGGMTGCLERWGFLTVRLDPQGPPRPLLRDGWGSGRGVRPTSTVDLTPKGIVARDLWPDVLASVESRWEARWPQQISHLRTRLSAIVAAAGVAMPAGFPIGLTRPGWWNFSSSETNVTSNAPMWTLLSQALLAAAMDFDRRNTCPLELLASTLRVITDAGVPTSEIPERSGISAEPQGAHITALTKLGLISLHPSPAGKGKTARLTSEGLDAQREYDIVTRSSERSDPEDNELRQVLAPLFTSEPEDAQSIRAAIRPPEGVRRSGANAPAMGRLDVTAVSKKRNRDMARQTQRFLEDPLNALPEYYVADANRGFGP